MSKAIEVTDSNYKDILAKNKVVLLDFWAEWCGPCRMISPMIDELSEEYAGRVFIGKVNVDNNPQAAGAFGIRSIPSILLFKDGDIVDKQIGAVPKSVLESALKAQLNVVESA